MFELKVGSSALVEGADYALSSIHNLKEALPQIWEGQEEEEEEASPNPRLDQSIIIIQASAVETAVRA